MIDKRFLQMKTFRSKNLRGENDKGKSVEKILEVKIRSMNFPIANIHDTIFHYCESCQIWKFYSQLYKFEKKKLFKFLIVFILFRIFIRFQ